MTSMRHFHEHLFTFHPFNIYIYINIFNHPIWPTILEISIILFHQYPAFNHFLCGSCLYPAFHRQVHLRWQFAWCGPRGWERLGFFRRFCDAELFLPGDFGYGGYGTRYYPVLYAENSTLKMEAFEKLKVVSGYLWARFSTVDECTACHMPRVRTVAGSQGYLQ